MPDDPQLSRAEHRQADVGVAPPGPEGVGLDLLDLVEAAFHRGAGDGQDRHECLQLQGRALARDP